MINLILGANKPPPPKLYLLPVLFLTNYLKNQKSTKKQKLTKEKTKMSNNKKLIKLTNEKGEVIYLPSLLHMKLAVYKKFVKILKEIPNGDASGLDNSTAIETNDRIVEAAEVLMEAYPEYAAFSEDFGFIDHIKTVVSIAKGTNTENVKDELSVTPENPAEDDDSFLSPQASK